MNTTSLIKKKISFSLSRIYRFLTENNRDFCIVSAERGDYSSKENDIRTSNLQKDIRSLKLGFIKVKGGYTETLKDGTQQDIIEDSFVIPSITKKDAINLGKKYEQETIFWKDNDLVAYIDCRSEIPTYKFKNDLSIQKEKVKEYFTQFKNKGKRKFVFLSEEREPSVYAAYKKELGDFSKLDI